MSKKWQILIVVGAMAVIYLGLLVGIPALINMIPPCGGCDSANVSNVTANGTPIFHILDSEGIDITTPYSELYKAPWIIYSIPGLVGIAWIVVILKQKKEAK